MKVFRLIFALALIVAGVLLLLSRPVSAQTRPPGNPAPTMMLTHITVVDAGTVGKPDVVLIPGMGSSRAVWDAETKLLAPNYRVHLVQLNGFGGAPAGGNATAPGVASAILTGVVEDLHVYIEASRMHPAVVGHSMGGLLALMLADKYPADVSKMVIVDTLPFYGMSFEPNATVDSIAPQAKVIYDQMIAMPADQFAAMIPISIAQLIKNANGQKLVTAMTVASDRTVFANTMLEDLQTDLRPDMAKIKTPALLIYPWDASASPDPTGIDAVYIAAYKAMPNMKLQRIDDSRHFIMYDQPAKMDAAIEGFLK
jgi:pimeloyl-ACP methyl ester carboxylesterase